mgnify:CR=1 FL=1
MSYYSVPNQGNILINLITVHFNLIFCLVIILLIGIVELILLILRKKGVNARWGILRAESYFLCGLMFMACGSIMSTVTSASDRTYYTSSDNVSRWTDNTVYLVDPGVTDGNAKKDPKLITRTASRINADSPSVVEYLMNHRQTITNVEIDASLKQTVAMFDTPDGPKTVVAYATEKEEKEAKKAKTKLQSAVDLRFNRAFSASPIISKKDIKILSWRNE